MKTPNSASAAPIAAPGTAIDSIARRIAARRASRSSAAAAGARAPTGSGTDPETGDDTAGASMLTPAPMAASVRLPDDALHQVVHLLERHVGLLLLRARRDHHLAGVVLQRTFVDDHRAVHELRLGGVGL